MKLTGFLLLAAGWTIVTAALFILHSPPSRAAFVLSGVAIQILGLIIAVRSHHLKESEKG